MASTCIAPTGQTVLPDDIWEDILLRLDAAADLARASAACSSFRRIVSECRFLRHFRSLHSPPVLGFISRDIYKYRGFLPVEPPHRFAREARPLVQDADHGFLPVGPPHHSAPEARALVQAADFTFSFLLDPSAWRFRHARDGRVLLGQRISTKTKFQDFLVCDPLHRRYVKIPRIPDDLIPSAADNDKTQHLFPVLTPSFENDEGGSFRVICAVQYVQHIGQHKAMALVFSSCNQTWLAIISTMCLPYGFIQYMPYYAHGCLYWMFFDQLCSLMLDTREMEFSIIELPPHNFLANRAIVEAEEGRLRLITIASNGTSGLYCKNWQSNGVRAQELQHDKLIPLPKISGVNYVWEIDGIEGRYLALSACNENEDGSSPNSEHFVLDIKTLLVEKFCSSNNDLFYGGFPYARFPPPFGLPSI